MGFKSYKKVNQAFAKLRNEGFSTERLVNVIEEIREVNKVNAKPCEYKDNLSEYRDDSEIDYRQAEMMGSYEDYLNG